MTTPAATLAPPANTITRIGFHRNFCSSRKPPAKIPAITQSVLARSTGPALPQKAELKIEIHAAAIIPTTAGLREPRIPWITVSF